MSDHTNLNHNMKGLAHGAERVPVRTDDIFDKAFGFTRADEAMEAGIYPYFKPISEQHGGTVKVDGREMIITGSNDYLGLTQDPRLENAAMARLRPLRHELYRLALPDGHPDPARGARAASGRALR